MLGVDWSTLTYKPPAPNKNQCELMIKFLHDVNMEQMCDQPTRGRNILDLMLTNHPNLVNKCYIGPGVSDHDAIVIMDTNVAAEPNQKQPRKVWLYEKADWDSVRSFVEEKQGEFFGRLPDEQSVKQNWSFIREVINKCLDDHIPSKMINGHYNPPWIKGNIKRMRRKKNRLHKVAKKYENPRAWKRYRLHRRATDRATDLAYLDYINDILEPSLDKNSKNLFKYMKSQKRDTFGISNLAFNGKIGTTSKEKSQILNDKFCSVFTRENCETAPTMKPSPYPEMERILVTNHGVKLILQKLNVSKATGPDGVPARILKDIFLLLHTSLHYIVSLSSDAPNNRSSISLAHGTVQNKSKGTSII